jgi:hypothetical protein
MGTEREFQAYGVNCFMKFTPGQNVRHFYAVLSTYYVLKSDADFQWLKINMANIAL